MTPQAFLIALAAWIVVAVLAYREAKAQKVKGAAPETWAIAIAVAGPLALPIFLHRRWQTLRDRMPQGMPTTLPVSPGLAVCAGILALALLGLWGTLAVDLFRHQPPAPSQVSGLYVSEEAYAAFFSGLMGALHGVAAYALFRRRIWSTAWGLWLPLFDLLAVLSGDATYAGWLPYDWVMGAGAIMMAVTAFPLRRRWLGYVAAHHVTTDTPHL